MSERALTSDPGSAAAAAAAPTVDRETPVTTVHTSYVTAQHVPQKRQIKALLKEAVDIAELSGEIFFYRWETTTTNQQTGEKEKGYIVGPSVKLANEAARIFGNCVVQQKPVQETAKAWIFTSAFIDLETGFTRERQFRMDKQFPIYGRMDKFRKDDSRFQIGQSKSDRNVTLNALPQIIVDKMLKAAIQSVRNSIVFKIENTYGGDINKAIDETLKAMSKYSIDQTLIERKLGLKRKLWDVDTLVILYGDYKALEGGEHTKATLYSLDETDDPNGGAEAESEKPGLSLKDMELGNPESHQSVAGKTTEAKDERAELIQKLQAMSEDSAYTKVPGLTAHFANIVDKLERLTVKDLQNEIANIDDVKTKHEKRQKKDGQQGSLV